MPAPQGLIEKYANKKTSFRFHGRELEFFLSQALFSSYSIDRGSRILLDSLSQDKDLSQRESLYDLGCGVGVLGISVKKAFPHIPARLQDKDALAAAFSRINAELNGVEGLEISAGPAFHGYRGSRFDLILSNIPAKVGPTVLRHLYREIITHLSPSGRAAVVVVQAIADQTEALLQGLGAQILFRLSEREHRVLHFTAPEEPLTGSSVVERLEDAYFRDTLRCKADSFSYTLDTIWGSADFDTPPYTVHLAAKLLPRLLEQWKKESPRFFIWNPGQGHLAMLLGSVIHSVGLEEASIHCGGRDWNETELCRHNLRLYAPPQLPCQSFPLPDPAFFDPPEGTRYQALLVELENLGNVPPVDSVFQTAGRVLAPGGVLVILGKAAHVHRFARPNRRFSTWGDKKYRSYRILALADRKKTSI
ncbi:MAG TPA: hypothetical protein ENN41_07400 [Sediminispirochaeta sp.]|nr:hypothetical protein [Sediminispirochaeta sp.]